MQVFSLGHRGVAVTMVATPPPKKADTRGLELKKGFAFLCIIIMCMLVFYMPIYVTDKNKIAYTKGNPSPRAPLPGLLLRHGSTVTAVDALVYQRYLQIQLDYDKQLSSIAKINYKPSEMFIDYGDPVRNYIPPNSSNTKRILAWTSFFGDMNYIPLKLKCGNNVTCEATYDRNDLLKSDAIVMHARNLGGIKQLPTKRLPHQRWVYFVMESPYHLGVQPVTYNGIFNYTETYRYDSDAQAKYFSLFKRETPLLEVQFSALFTEIMETKFKLVSIMNSNCGASHTTRLSYVRDLQTHIPVDTYGRCGKLKCARNSPECEKTMTSYKFYLSMENSHCRNYVTEKPGHPLFRWRAVPIVMGGADPSDYERALPPGSYIHTAGFKTTKELAEYLLILDKNPVLYERYHEWRKNYTGQIYFFHEAWCNLCLRISNDSLPVQTYKDFKGWYDQDTCHS